MKCAMISQPCRGKTEQEITATRERATAVLEAKGYTVLNTLHTDEWSCTALEQAADVQNKALYFLAVKSLTVMAVCEAVYFCKGWENARGCKIEHDAASAYGLTIIYEE